MATLQVKGMDDDLYRALGACATREHRSISQQVVVVIKQYLAGQAHSAAAEAAALLQLGNSWEDDVSAEATVARIRESRATGNRFEGNDVLD